MLAKIHWQRLNNDTVEAEYKPISIGKNDVYGLTVDQKGNSYVKGKCCSHCIG